MNCRSAQDQTAIRQIIDLTLKDGRRHSLKVEEISGSLFLGILMLLTLLFGNNTPMLGIYYQYGIALINYCDIGEWKTM